MGYANHRVRLGDSTESSLPPNILDVLVALVLTTRRVGSLVHEIEHLRDQQAGADERAAAIRADLQRFGRQAEIGLRATAAESRWPQVQEHGSEAVASLHKSIKKWQDRYSVSTERSRRKYQKMISELGRDLWSALAKFLEPRTAEFSDRSLRRRWASGGYTDVLTLEPFGGVKLELEAAATSAGGPQKLRSIIRGVELVAGTKRKFLRGLQPNRIKLDDYFVLGCDVGPTAAMLTLCRKANGLGERVVVELGLSRGVVTGSTTVDAGARNPIPVDSRAVLSKLWRALQSETQRAASSQMKLRSLALDGKGTREPNELLVAFERSLAHYSPIIDQLVEHSPDPDELVVKLEDEEGNVEELYVLRADLAQHLLALPPRMQKRLAPRTLLGSEAVLQESDLIDLGVIVQPDAGEDSAVISLQDVAAPAAPDLSNQAIHELVYDDLTQGGAPALVAEDDDKSGCYDLDQLMSSAR